jgi:putative DNA primase/helicase
VLTTLADVISRVPGRKVRLADGYLIQCLVHEDSSPSLHVSVGRTQPLVGYCHGGCPQDAVVRALAALGLGADLGPIDYRADHREQDDQQRIERAREVWSNARCAAASLVERYLNSRAITTAIPPSIRFAPSLRHPTGNWHPAMVAAVQRADDGVYAVHRTFLADREGTIIKAAVEPNKMALGPIRGGAVRLATAGPVLVICEGIETGLSILQATGLPTWAALGTANLAAVVLPPFVREVIIGADADPAGEAAARRAVEAFRLQGRRSRVVRPPSGFNDFNDVLRDSCGESAGR